MKEINKLVCEENVSWVLRNTEDMSRLNEAGSLSRLEMDLNETMVTLVMWIGGQTMIKAVMFC